MSHGNVLFENGTNNLFDSEDFVNNFLIPESPSLGTKDASKILDFENEADPDGLTATGLNGPTKRVTRPVEQNVNAAKGELLPEPVDKWLEWLDISDNQIGTGPGTSLDPNFPSIHNHALDRLQLQGANSPNPRERKRNKSISGASGGQRLGKEDTSHEEEEEVVEEGRGRLQMGNPYEFSNPALFPEGAYEALAEATAFAESSRSFVYPYAVAPQAPNSLTPNWYNGETSPTIKADFGVNTKAEQFMQKPSIYAPTPAHAPARRRSVSTRPTPTYAQGVPGFALRDHQLNSQLRASDSDKPELDANYVKLALMELGYPNTKKDPKGFCNTVVHYICEYAKIFVGGFYLNNNNPHSPTSSWILTCTYPSTAQFNQYFHYNVGERFIMQAAVEKRCFCVHSSSWENSNGLLSFLFVPIPNENNPNANAIAVMVLGTILKGEVDLHAHLLFLDQVRKPVASTLRMLLQIQHNLSVLQKLDTLQVDNEAQRQTNVFERAMLAVISQVKVDPEEYAVIATTLKGLITYVSTGAVRTLGYAADDLVGKATLTQLHDFVELNERSKELELECNRIFPADFPVLIQKTLMTRGQDDTRNWRWIRKDRQFINMQVTIRPLYDENAVFGFVAIAKEVGSNPPRTPQPNSPHQASQTTRSPPLQPKSVSSPQQVQQDEAKSE